MDSAFKIALIGAIGGLVGGLITGVIAPHIAWGIEQRRIKLNDRREKIKEWRQMMKVKDFNRDRFRNTTAYSTLRPYLTPKLVAEIEDPIIRLELNTGEPVKRTTTLKAKILDEIAEIEGRWKLLE
jgi:hypothetical protein